MPQFRAARMTALDCIIIPRMVRYGGAGRKMGFSREFAISERNHERVLMAQGTRSFRCAPMYRFEWETDPGARPALSRRSFTTVRAASHVPKPAVQCTCAGKQSGHRVSGLQSE